MSPSPSPVGHTPACSPSKRTQAVNHVVHSRVRKACDRCRTRKIKCDGHDLCARCKLDNWVCTYGSSRKPPRVHPKGYVEVLEQQRKQLIAGLEGMYWRLVSASAWENPLLHDDTGKKPHPHSIVSALGCLDTTLEVTSAAESPIDSSLSPQAALSMCARDIAPRIKTVDLPDSDAGSRREGEEQEGDSRQARNRSPTASMPWSQIDLSFLLPEPDLQADNRPSSPRCALPESFGRSAVAPEVPEPKPMQAVDNNNNNAEDFIWPCGDETYDFMFPAIDDVDVDLKRLEGTSLGGLQPGPTHWHWALKLPKSDYTSTLSLQTLSRA